MHTAIWPEWHVLGLYEVMFVLKGRQAAGDRRHTRSEPHDSGHKDYQKATAEVRPLLFG